MIYFIRKMYWSLKAMVMQYQLKEFEITSLERQGDKVMLNCRSSSGRNYLIRLTLQMYFKLYICKGDTLLTKVTPDLWAQPVFDMRHTDLLCVEANHKHQFDSLRSITLLDPILKFAQDHNKAPSDERIPYLEEIFKLTTLDGLPLRPGVNVGEFTVFPYKGRWDCYQLGGSDAY